MKFDKTDFPEEPGFMLFNQHSAFSHTPKHTRKFLEMKKKTILHLKSGCQSFLMQLIRFAKVFKYK